MDFLDVPIVHLLGPMFFEHHPDGIEKAEEIATDTPMRFAFDETVRRLEQAEEFQPGCRIIELGDPAMATISLKVIRMDAGAICTFEPSTLSAIYSPMQGAGSVTMENDTFAWSRGDSIAGPSAYPQR